jgi:geranylgeranyl transferase type-1 subunit beta
MTGDTQIPLLDPARHIKFFQRCLRLLPAPYTANDSTRLGLAYFGLAGLDLLSPSTSSNSLSPSSLPITPAERISYRDWVLSHQHPGGGFAGSPTHILPHRLRAYDGWTAGTDYKDGRWEMGSPGVANIAATSFALKLLALLADPAYPAGAFSDVDRVRTLEWLRRLQREDGSFGEVLEEMASGADGEERLVIAGGRDMRYSYLAATIRYMLRGDLSPGEEGWTPDFDVDRLIQHIKRSQTYDGGVAETAGNEAHAGYTYCAAASLQLLGGGAVKKGIADLDGLVKNLVSRQFPFVDVEEKNGAENHAQPPSLSSLTLDDQLLYSGYNGRTNKVADTCYAWWVSGALAILAPHLASQQGAAPSPTTLLSAEASRAFLLTKTQHVVGGFGKHAGDPPDIYHGFLGLAALATLQSPHSSAGLESGAVEGPATGLKETDPALVMSVDAVRTVKAAREELLVRAKKQKALAEDLLQLGLKLGPEAKRPAWLDVKS